MYIRARSIFKSRQQPDRTRGYIEWVSKEVLETPSSLFEKQIRRVERFFFREYVLRVFHTCVCVYVRRVYINPAFLRTPRRPSRKPALRTRMAAEMSVAYTPRFWRFVVLNSKSLARENTKRTTDSAIGATVNIIIMWVVFLLFAVHYVTTRTIKDKYLIRSYHWVFGVFRWFRVYDIIACLRLPRGGVLKQ